MPDTNAEISHPITLPRGDILNKVGLSEDSAREIAQKEARERLRLPRARENGGNDYQQSEAGLQIETITLGTTNFTIEPVNNSQGLITEVIEKAKESPSAIPQDELNEYLIGAAQRALEDPRKNFAVAVTALNHVSRGDFDGSEHEAALLASAQTDEEKYHLAHVLEEVITAPQPQEISTIPASAIGEPTLGATAQFPPDSLPTFDSSMDTTINDTSDTPTAINIPTVQPASIETATPTYMPLEPKLTPGEDHITAETLRPVAAQQEPVPTGRLQGVLGGIKGVAETLVAPKGPQQ